MATNPHNEPHGVLPDGVVPHQSERIETDRLVLRAPRAKDHAAWAAAREQSREHLERWEPSWSDHEFTPRSFRKRLKWYREGAGSDTSYSFFIEAKKDAGLIGGVTLDAIRRGTTQRAVLGYWLVKSATGHGYMTEAVRAVTRFAFDDLKLHRLEAASIPENVASVRVLERAGFEREGYMRAYIRIDGAWQDHLLFATINPDSAPSAAA